MCCERHALTPMVVNDLDIVRIALPERKADAPACIHRHRPLPRTVSLELVKPNTLERTEVLQTLCDIQGRQQVHCRGEIQAAKLVGRFAVPDSAAGGIA